MEELEDVMAGAGEEEAPEGEGEGKEEETPQEEGGQFKTKAEAERAYAELRTTFNSRDQEVAELRRIASTANQGNPSNDDPTERFNTQFFENPAAVLPQLISQALAQERQAATNREAVMEQFESDPMYPQVKARFKQELAKLDPAYLADPNAATQTGEAVYNALVGEHIRKNRGAPPKRTDPGLARPGATEDTPVVTREERDILAQLGLEKKDQKDVLDRYIKGEAD